MVAADLKRGRAQQRSDGLGTIISRYLSRMHHRIFGLDLMRAVAIVLVVFSHADDLWAAWFPYDPGLSRVDGVDLFFVLSGYLIGGILLRYTALEGVPWHRRLLDFWQRRWLRTLPNYYLFLVINIALVHFGLAMGLLNHNTLAYFVFLQNLHVPVDLFFFESWSLAIEEWFYLLFPVLLVLVALLGVAGRRAYLVAALLMVAVPTWIRFQVAPEVASLQGMDLYIRKLVVTRLDGIGFGVLAAWVQVTAIAWWQRLRSPAFLCGGVLLGLAALLHGEPHLWFTSTWYFTLSAIAMALFLPVLSQWTHAPRWGRPVVLLSKVSYALYLVHLPVRHLYLPLMEGRSMPATIVLYVLYWALCLALSWLVFRYWERPFMALRERLGKRLVPATPSS